jgi:photosystem II stability/assembly factor-like uncharacterized protein
MRSRFLALVATLLLAGCGSAPLAAGPAGSAPPGSAPAGPASPTQAASSSPAATGPGAPCQPSAGISASDFFGSYGHDALTGVQFISPVLGWVVGQHVILSTDNGGATWTAQRRGELDLTSVDFISASTGWAVGLDSLLTTSDGGRHWTVLPEPCGVIRSVHFVSPQVGYAIAGGVDPVAADALLVPATGGAVVSTTNGGESWQPIAAPADPQSVCFSDRENGWLGADGKLYESADGGRSWQMRAAGDGKPATPGIMIVQCASGAAWALDIGPGAASSQEPHIGFYAPAGTAARPLFAELYFQPPGSPRLPESAGAYAGPMSVISTGAAAFIDTCAPCGRGFGTVPWLIATAHGGLSRKGNVAGINQPTAASFLTPALGWVVGAQETGSADRYRIVRTGDGGRTWQVQYPAG